MSKAKKSRKGSKKSKKAATWAGTPWHKQNSSPAREAPGAGETSYVVDMHSVYSELEIDYEALHSHAGRMVSFDTFGEAKAYALDRVESGIEALQLLAEALRAAGDMASLDLGRHEPMLTVWVDGDQVRNED